jgi:hypothetical protein
MLGIGRPDSHALPRITPMKHADRDACSPPARAGSFFHPLPTLNDDTTLSQTWVRVIRTLPLGESG